MKEFIVFLVVVSVFSCTSAQTKEKPFTESLGQDSCQFLTTGRNTYFILEPGYQLVLEGKEDNELVRLVITVLNETRTIGGVETRVVEENESVNGKTVEISRNYFAYCKSNSSIYYFGEEVDNYKDGKIVNHDGAWITGGKNKAGVIMPGLVLIGARYYQEIAPGIAMDRAEIISISEKLVTTAETFTSCLKVEETTPLEPKNREYKLHAPGIGLIKDGDLILVKYGFLK